MPRTWQDRYADKLKTGEEALSCIQRGQQIYVGSGAATPRRLLAGLSELAAAWRDREAIHLWAWTSPYAADESPPFPLTLFGAIGTFSPRDPLISYAPLPLWLAGRALRSGEIPLHVALVQVTPPDEQGLCSLGPDVDLAADAVAGARIVVAEVNPHLPRTAGDSCIPITNIAALVQADDPPLEFHWPSADEMVRRIARQAARLVSDGATIHISADPVGQGVVEALREKRDLGLHTSVFTDGLMALIRAGVITNERQTLAPGRSVVSAALGTAPLYAFIRAHEAIAFHPSSYVSDPEVIARQEAMTALQSAVAVDLIGQGCFARLGVEPEYTGGDVAFARGATRAPRGRSVLLVPSTTSDGAGSRISMALPPGSSQLLTWGDVDDVVSEYGTAELRGRTLPQRAIALISIAHPRFRAALLQQAKETGYLPADQPLPTGIYPDELETTATFKGGTLVRFRPIKPADEALFTELFYSLSRQTAYYRFFSSARSLSRDAIQSYTTIDYEQKLAIVGLVKDGARERMIAMGEYAVDPVSRMADVALVVQDDYQRQGIGTWLLFYLGYEAQRRGLAGLQADLLATNSQALALVRRCGYQVTTSLREGYFHISYRFPKDADSETTEGKERSAA